MEPSPDSQSAVSYASIWKYVYGACYRLITHRQVRTKRSVSSNIRGLRFEYECEIEYENDFLIPVLKLHIIMTYTHFIPFDPLYLKPTLRARAQETSLVQSKASVDGHVLWHVNSITSDHKNSLVLRGASLLRHFEFINKWWRERVLPVKATRFPGVISGLHVNSLSVKMEKRVSFCGLYLCLSDQNCIQILA